MTEEHYPPTQLALTVPKEMQSLASGSERIIAEATTFICDSEAAFQLADELQARLKAQAKQINTKRMEFTRPIDAVKKAWMEWFNPAIDVRQEAAGIYQQKMTAYRRECAEKTRLALLEAEQLLRAERDKKEREAERLVAKAAQLKTAAARDKALAQAEESRQLASMMPETVEVASLVPATVASNIAELWRAEVVDMQQFLGWLLTRPEWHCVLQFRESELNRLAKQCQSVVKVPGVKFVQKESYRTRAR